MALKPPPFPKRALVTAVTWLNSTKVIVHSGLWIGLNLRGRWRFFGELPKSLRRRSSILLVRFSDHHQVSRGTWLGQHRLAWESMQFMLGHWTIVHHTYMLFLLTTLSPPPLPSKLFAVGPFLVRSTWRPVQLSSSFFYLSVIWIHITNEIAT